MIYVLILIWPGPCPAMTTAEFNSWDACQKAGKLTMEYDERIRFVCSEKDSKP